MRFRPGWMASARCGSPATAISPKSSTPNAHGIDRRMNFPPCPPYAADTARIALEGRGFSPAGGGFRWCGRRVGEALAQAPCRFYRPTDSLELLLDGVGLDLHDLRLVERATLGREHDLACYLSIRRRHRVDERVPADVGRWAERLQDLEHGHGGLHLLDVVEAYVLASRRPHPSNGHPSGENHPNGPSGRTSHVSSLLCHGRPLGRLRILLLLPADATHARETDSPRNEGICP